jgi:hypothetical protein
MTTYGYARVSTNGQDLGSQETELLAAGCAKVFKEKVSGAKTDRAELAKVIRRPQWVTLVWLVLGLLCVQVLGQTGHSLR